MTTHYGHFCLAARALETVGERWSLLIVRDLLDGPRRFGDLQRLLTNVTPKWLTIRLRRLEHAGIVERHQQPGRREVWYELTAKGRDLAPVLEALLAWGLKYERHPLAPDETVHPEHLIAGIEVALNEVAPKPARQPVWRFGFSEPKRSFTLAFDGERWSLVEDGRRPDVVVDTTAGALASFVTKPPARRRLPSRDIRLSGDAARVAELIDVFRATPASRLAQVDRDQAAPPGRRDHGRPQGARDRGR
ncbi:MAG TPA: helix-turn-helix domain-containing protein [Solirubrobacteraceae bacterium]|nr:helix-turn-helix domain-containing protein [Solirubrobacteraceae bacterium]